MGYGENVPDVIETLTDVCIQATASLMIQRSSQVIVQSLLTKPPLTAVLQGYMPVYKRMNNMLCA